MEEISSQSKKISVEEANQQSTTNSYFDEWSAKLSWEDSDGLRHEGRGDILEGWRWGLSLKNVPHPAHWTPALWAELEKLIVSNGLITLPDDVVCTAEEEAKIADLQKPVDLDNITDDWGYLDALHQSMSRLVAMETLLLGQSKLDKLATEVSNGCYVHGIDRALTIAQARMMAKSEHIHM